MNDRCRARRPPFSAGGVLVRSIDRAVDAVPLIVPVCLQCLKQPGPRTLLRPPIKPVKNRLPRPKLCWEISPWNARPPPPQDGFHKLPIVISSATWAPPFCQDRSDLPPLPIVQLESNHRLPRGAHAPSNGKQFPAFRARARARARLRGNLNSGTGTSARRRDRRDHECT